MRVLTAVLLTTLAMTGVATAEDKGSSSGEMQKSGQMKGPPNADGAAKSESTGQDKTGTGDGGAASAKATGEDKANK